jgi:hypothetical protein
LYQSSDRDNLQLRIIIRQDESYSYQAGRWGRNLPIDQRDFTLEDPQFGYWVKRFLDAPTYSGTKFGANQRAIVDQFYNYMWSYWSWAQPTPPFPSTAGDSQASPQNPFYSTVYNAQWELDNYTANLISASAASKFKTNAP